MKKRRMALVLIFVMCSVMISGCLFSRHRRTGSSTTEKAPRQVLWQIRQHIVQVAKDLELVHKKKFITGDRYTDLKLLVERCAITYNRLRSHYELFETLNQGYLRDIEETLGILAELTGERGE